jgi:hypothetical protein
VRSLYSLPAALLIGVSAHAATYERPAGAYTPTNHSVNTTKYQIDSANQTPISSVKVDGDINKAFQGLNELDARTPPSVLGNAGKVLSNNGTSTTWVTLSSDTLISGSTRVTANAAGTISLTAGGVTAYFNSGGLIAAGISGSAISGTSVYGSIVRAEQVSSTYLSGTLAALSAAHIPSLTATVITATTISAATINSAGVAKSWLDMGTCCTSAVISASHNVSAVSRIAQGEFNVSWTTPLASANYAVVGTCYNPQTSAQDCIVSVKNGGKSAGGVRLLTRYSGAQADPAGVYIAVFGF